MNPYEPPLAESAHSRPLTESTSASGLLAHRIFRFISLKGTFSRGELLLVTLMLVILAFAISFVSANSESWEVSMISSLMFGALYFIWGVALGKRSRDLGATFTYGMIIGMIFPVMGLVFLFQPGAKRLSQNPG